ncbi:MAG: hypothetical protein JNJ61_05115 [Anaerolineae bacterium]|nr:hypothetical protein [Anaerolineae bacterium]
MGGGMLRADGRQIGLVGLLLCALLLGACSGGAVVFAPTAAPPDVSPLTYTHPGGAFSVTVPRNWSVYAQNTTTLASAVFAAPGADEPALRFAVINTGARIASSDLADILNRYQTQIRPDVRRYNEVSRQAMGDGSWRLTGVRRTAAGLTQQVNTFIQPIGSLLTVAEVIIPDDGVGLEELQRSVNTFRAAEDTALEATDAVTLAFAVGGSLDLLNVRTWTTPAGVFFVTGEVANNGAAAVRDLPVRAVLRSADGLPIAEAVDVVMGYEIPAGGFAPFSLRFGQGQPSLTASYELVLGGADWQPVTEGTIYGSERLTWTDTSQVGADGVLEIIASVTNTSSETVHEPRIVATVFDANGAVIAAAYNDFALLLNPGDTASARLLIAEMGGTPANYILTVQGKP